MNGSLKNVYLARGHIVQEMAGNQVFSSHQILDKMNQPKFAF